MKEPRIEIVEVATGYIIDTIKLRYTNARSVESVLRGIQINLSPDYFTRTVDID